MSRSQPALTNPATRFFEWKGGKGELSFWDKENKVSVTVPLPFEFLVLDELATITGYNKQEKSGYWSNEVRSTVKEELHVRTSSGTKYIGFYKNDQGIVQMPKGASYAKSIYIAYKTKNGYEIGNIKASGSALGAWIEFGSKHVVSNGKVTLTKGVMQESPVGEFYAPEFTWSHSDKEEDAEAIELDKQLQVYLSQYLAAAQFNRSQDEDEPAEEVTGTDMSAELSDEDMAALPKEKQGAYKAMKRHDEDDQAVDDYIKSTEVNIDDIPF